MAWGVTRVQMSSIPNTIRKDDERRARYQMASSAEGESGKDVRLTKLGLAVRAYTVAHHGTLPPLENAIAARSALAPYASSTAIFKEIRNSAFYIPNASLSRRKKSTIKVPDMTVVYYCPDPGPVGCYRALFVDGSSHEVTSDEWAALKKISGIP